MTTKELITLLQQAKPNTKVLLACDEEWNTLYKDIEIDLDEDGNAVLFGLSGSEVGNEPMYISKEELLNIQEKNISFL